MKRTWLFLLLLAGAFGCSNDPEMSMVPDAEQAIFSTAGRTRAVDTAVLDPVDSTVRISVGDQMVYGNQSIQLENGSYPVNMEFLINGKWSNTKLTSYETTGDVSVVGPYRPAHLVVDGTGTLTITQVVPGDDRISCTIYINPVPEPQPVPEVRFTIGDQVIGGGDTLTLAKGEYVVNMEFRLPDGTWSNTHTAAYETTGDVQMSGYYPPTIAVSGDGSLTITQVEPSESRITGTIYIVAEKDLDKTIRFTIGDRMFWGGDTVTLAMGEYVVNMEFQLPDGRWSNTHTTIYDTTGDVHMSGLYPPMIVVSGDGSLTVTQFQPSESRITGTIYIVAR